MRRIIFLFAILSFFLSIFVDLCFAQPDEFKISESKYFNIYSQEKLDLLKLIRRLDIRSEYLSLKSSSFGQEKLEKILEEIIDAIFLEAQDSLHMYIYNFKGNIKICQNQKELNNAFHQFSDHNLYTPSFYIHDTNSIYLNFQDIRLEALAYEIARSIISHYFVVLPTEDVQEILAKDVGYRIKKLAK